MFAVLTLAAAALSQRALVDAAKKSEAVWWAYAITRSIETGAVVATFFLTCFVVAEFVHAFRSRR